MGEWGGARGGLGRGSTGLISQSGSTEPPRGPPIVEMALPAHRGAAGEEGGKGRCRKFGWYFISAEITWGVSEVEPEEENQAEGPRTPQPSEIKEREIQ